MPYMIAVSLEMSDEPKIKASKKSASYRIRAILSLLTFCFIGVRNVSMLLVAHDGLCAVGTYR